MEELELFFDTVWAFISMKFTLYGYTFSFAQIGFFGVVSSWGLWAYLRFVDGD